MIMKKTFIAAAVLSTIAGTVSAQVANSDSKSFSVLYGVVDVGAGITSKVHDANSEGAKDKAKFNFGSGQNSGNRWGFYIKERLGGGLYAVGRLESGFSIGNGSSGQGGKLFGRQAYFGLGNDSFGVVTLGRQETSTNFVTPFAIGDILGGIAATPFDFNNLDGTYKVNNSIKYTSPNFYGIRATGLYSIGGVTGKFSGNQVYSFGLSYGMPDENGQNGQPLKVAAAFLNADNPKESLVKANLSAESVEKILNKSKEVSLSNVLDFGLVNSLNLFSEGYRVMTGGASYTIKNATLGLLYSNTRFKNLGQTKSNITWHDAQANLAYKVTSALKLAAGYTFSRGSEAFQEFGFDGKPVLHTASLGSIYSLSNRTSIYLVGAYQRTNGAIAKLNDAEFTVNKNQIKGTVGIVHKF